MHSTLPSINITLLVCAIPQNSFTTGVIAYKPNPSHWHMHGKTWKQLRKAEKTVTAITEKVIDRLDISDILSTYRGGNSAFNPQNDAQGAGYSPI